MKILFSAILAMLVATAVIWASLIVLIFSVLSAPIVSWWMGRKIKRADIFRTEKKQTTPQKKSYKVVEAQYEIIEK